MKLKKIKKQIKNAIYIIKTTIVYVSVIFLILMVITSSGLLVISPSYGVSNGKPFCLRCLTISTSLIKNYNIDDL